MCLERCGCPRGCPCRRCVCIGADAWTYVHVCARACRAQVCGCVWFRPTSAPASLAPHGMRGAGAERGRVPASPACVQRHQSSAQPWPSRFPGSHFCSQVPAEGKRRGVSHPGPNGEEEKGREGWGRTSSSGEVRITTHPCAPLHHEVRNKTSKFTSGGSRKSHWDMHTQRKALSPEG